MRSTRRQTSTPDCAWSDNRASRSSRLRNAQIQQPLADRLRAHTCRAATLHHTLQARLEPAATKTWSHFRTSGHTSTHGLGPTESLAQHRAPTGPDSRQASRKLGRAQLASACYALTLAPVEHRAAHDRALRSVTYQVETTARPDSTESHQDRPTFQSLPRRDRPDSLPRSIHIQGQADVAAGQPLRVAEAGSE